MVTLYLLDVPEFASFARVAQEDGHSVQTVGDYVKVTASDRLLFERTRVNVRPAIWFAALTGGYVGRLSWLDDDQLCLTTYSNLS